MTGLSDDRAGMSATPTPLQPPIDLTTYRTAVVPDSIGQIVTSFGGFLAVTALMYLLADRALSGAGFLAWAGLLPLAVLAAGFVVRIFIIQHDCGHEAFFRSRRANAWLGAVCGLFTLTPFPMWRRQHAQHHAAWNDLDRRDAGLDIYSSCLTVVEYQQLGDRARRRYRLLRHPLVAQLLLPPIVFILLYRLPFDAPRSWRHERRAVHLTTLAAAAVYVALGWLFGFGLVLLVHLPIMAVASIVGVWLFSVQHRFEGTRWLRHDQWGVRRASLEGSSYLRLPPILRWFTGNIGFHHVHHLNPRIANYRLRACHEANPALQRVRTLSLADGLGAWRFALWDEAAERMVSFREAEAGRGGITAAG